MDIAGKVAFVSGGGSGIGRGTVLAFARKGASVVVADIDTRAGNETLKLVTDEGGRAMFHRCDVTKTGDLESAFGAATSGFGGLDIVFNNAGIGDEDLFADDPGDWRRLVEIDLNAVIDATRLAVRAMKKSGHGGVIINTASLIGLEPMGFAPVYSAAKAGVIGFTRALAHLAEESRIRVNAVCPEIVATPMTLNSGDSEIEKAAREGKMLTPEDIAGAVIELIEDESRAAAILKVTMAGGREYVSF
jgi:NAD(P)-dependent dehydrogenase (short-subunit alcohol dehydrogenase family)